MSYDIEYEEKLEEEFEVLEKRDKCLYEAVMAAAAEIGNYCMNSE